MYDIICSLYIFISVIILILIVLTTLKLQKYKNNRNRSVDETIVVYEYVRVPICSTCTSSHDAMKTNPACLDAMDNLKKIDSHIPGS